MQADCLRYVRNCVECRTYHSDQTRNRGMLHPLPIPDRPMQHLCMDFKEFPKSRRGNNCLLVIIDRLSKAPVSIPCTKDIDSRGLAELFVSWIYRFGHTPDSIVSDRGPQFISSFWKEFCRIIGVKLRLSTAYHKQTDGQTEIMNRYIDQRLRPFVNYYQDNWDDMIPMMDRDQITLPHSSLGMPPYKVLYGSDPKNSWDWKTPKATTAKERLNYADAVAAATRNFEALELAKRNMAEAQARMKRSVDPHRRDVDWKVGDKVYLSTKNLQQLRPSRKLSEQWKGPFEIVKKVGHAFKLALPDQSRIHDTFSPDVLLRDPDDPLPGQARPKPEGQAIAGVEEYEVGRVLASRLVGRTLKYNVSWVGHDPDPAWYPASNFMGSPHKLRDYHQQYPRKPGPPRSLQKWIKAWEDGEDDLSYLWDNRV